MRNILLFAFATLLLASCSKDKSDLSQVYINGKAAPTLKATTDDNDPQKLMTPHEIVTYNSGYFYDGYERRFELHGQLFAEDRTAGNVIPIKGEFDVDTINDRLVMPNNLVIKNGKPIYAWLSERNMYIQLLNEVGTPTDTVAYIPNDEMIDAMAYIDELFAKGELDNDRLSKIFIERFHFYPCTGKQFREQHKAYDMPPEWFHPELEFE